jgi:hypothetical protein
MKIFSEDVSYRRPCPLFGRNLLRGLKPRASLAEVKNFEPPESLSKTRVFEKE